MNPSQQKIQQRLDSFPIDLRPMADVCRQYLRYCSAIDIDETLLIAHRPWEAPAAYAFRVYPPAKDSWFSKYEKSQGFTIPSPVQVMLRTFNGCFAFELSLFGIPPSMVQKPAQLNRSELQCHDLAAANAHWKLEYKVDPGAFHFGGRAYSDDENSGYFLHSKSTISAVLSNGTLVGKWGDFTSFLTDELAAAEKFQLAKTKKDWWH